MKTYQNIITGKFQQARHQLFARSILAGVILSAAGFISLIAAATLGNLILNALLFSFGLVVIILLGAELFTSNCLMILQPRQTALIPRLITVYLFNFLGAAMITACLWLSGALVPYQDAIAATATLKASLTPVAMIFSGVIANFLVCTAAWIGAHEQGSAKLAGIIMPVMAFVIIKAEHSIANMFIFTAAALNGSFHPAFFTNLLFVTLGNILGGFLLALILHYHHKN
jgi:formate/nitrite transporter FocA (FNT family)